MSKYHARKVEADGLTFDSQAEHRRYCELKLLLAAGEIRDLQVHQKMTLMVQGVNCGYYESDFSYQAAPFRLGERITEDVKGVRTPVYRLKRKLVKALYNIDITEVPA